MNRFFSRRPFALVLAAIGVLALSSPAQAEERPYVLRGTAQFVSPTDFVGSGIATHLGLYDEVGSAQFLPTADPTVFEIDAWVILTAANGDQLRERVNGYLNGVTGTITATVTYVGGTGRFDDASGSSALLGQILPDGTIAVAVEGTIDY